AEEACAKSRRMFEEQIHSILQPLNAGGALKDVIPIGDENVVMHLKRLTDAASSHLPVVAELFGADAGAAAANSLSAIAHVLQRAHTNHRQTADNARLLGEVVRSAQTLASAIHKACKNFRAEKNLYRVYIPVLRGLRPLGTDQYLDRTTLDYFPSLREQGSRSPDQKFPGRIVTGLDLYGQVDQFKRGDVTLRRALEAYEAFLSRAFFDGERVEVVARLPTDPQGNVTLADERTKVLHIKIGKEKERPIYDLGDGLAQLLILTMPMFLYRDKHLLLFIEEPELYLHPGFQRLLIDAMLNEKCLGGSRQVFVATHSQHFMDITLESDRVSVFHCRKVLPEGDGDEKVPILRVRPRANASHPVLRELGVLNSSVLLANCTVWVEGVTDRMYLRRYLSLYQEHLGATNPTAPRFVEDLHFAFVEYGGANITHWSFLDEAGPNVERLCGELCLIADDDGVSAASASSAKAERHQRLSAVLGDRFHRLPCREIENLLSPEVLVAVVREYESSPELDVGPCGPNDYRHQRLGDFIESRLQSAGYTSKRRCKDKPYADASGSIKDKATFAERALRYITDWKHVSPDAQELAAWLYDFIRSRNVHGTRQAKPTP
ncbi:MAG: AAA family ATPase, partial [Fimbriimonadaceae bacterium]|nr:AAA family ATPase [Fimbriimonadaceae bacterium]